MSLVITKNKKAYFDYEIIEKYTSGILLLGSEVKSIRLHDIAIKEGYCHILNNEMWLKGVHIAPYKQSGTYQNHEPIRDRKLLLNKKEILKIHNSVIKKRFTIIPLSVIINDRGLIKIEIGLCKSKNNFDKRESLKEKDIKRNVDRYINY
jgi:SsrA-binding protein